MTARKIVDAIFEDLRDRRYLKWLFAKKDDANAHSLDPDVQRAIKSAWVKIINRELKECE